MISWFVICFLICDHCSQHQHYTLVCPPKFFGHRTSDVGRKFPFAFTLTISDASGLIDTFIRLSVAIFCLGFGIGAILSEFLRFIRMFNSWLIMPKNICENGQINMECDANDSMGLLNCTILCFRLGTNESNFLITQGEGARRGAINVLKSITSVNKCAPNTLTDDMILTVGNPMTKHKMKEHPICVSYFEIIIVI